MSARVLAMLWIGAVAIAPALARSAAPAPGGITVTSHPGGERVDVRLPGRLIDHAAARQPDGTHVLMLLVGDPVPRPPAGELPPEVPPCSRDAPGNPLSLWRLAGDPGAPRLERIRDDVAGDGVALFSRDLDGDGTEELLLVRPGELVGLPVAAGQSPETLLSDPAIDRSSAPPAGGADAVWLAVADVGRARFHRAAGRGRAWDEVAVELPIRASNVGSSLKVSSPTPRFVGRDARGLAVFATSPEPFGARRIRSFVIRPGAAPAEERIETCWAQLPEPEALIGWDHALLDGEPVLVAWTMPVGAMNLFGEMLVRVFPLKRDRSRTGHLPLAMFRSTINMLQSHSVRVFVRDLDGDGREDLVLGARQGFDGDKVVLDAYTRNADGTLRETPKTTSIKIKSEEADRIELGEDLDGDGREDLRVITEEFVHVFAGTGKLRPLADGPSRSMPLPEFGTREVDVQVGASTRGGQAVVRVGGSSAPRTVDLDADGVAELLLTGTLEDGRGWLSWFRFASRSTR